MNHKEEHHDVQQNLASYASGLAVIMSLIFGYILAMIAIAEIFDIFARYGIEIFYIVTMVIAALAVVMPNLIIVHRGSATFVKMNIANCGIQLLISFTWFLSGYHDLIVLNVASFILPVVCFVLIRSEPYQRFVTFYYQLHLLREEYRSIIKDAANKK